MNRRLRRTLLLCLGLGAIPGGLRAESPLPLSAGNPEERLQQNALVDGRAAAAQAALDQGYPTLAISLAREALLASPAEPEALRLILASAYLADGQAGMVASVLRELDAGLPAVQLRQAMAQFAQADPAAAQASLRNLTAEALPVGDRPWFELLQGLMQERAGSFEAANGHFARARELAPGAAARTQLDLLRLRSQLLSGKVDNDTVTQLRATERSLAGQRGGFEASRFLASTLFQLGRRDEALGVLQDALQRPGIADSGLRDNLLLLTGLIAGDTDPRGREALQRVVEAGASLDLSAQALQLLARAPLAGEGRLDFLAWLDGLIDRPTIHPQLDALLALRAVLRADLGRYEAAERDAQALLERYPGSSLTEDAVNLLAQLAWRRDPPRYRLAATQFSRLRTLVADRTERARLGGIVGDCYFLNGDYANAAAAYAAALIEPGQPEPGRMLFQWVTSWVRAGDFAAAAAALDSAGSNGLAADPARWQAEWNLADARRRAGRAEDAFARLTRLLGDNPTTPLPAPLSLRLRWLEARLSLDSGRAGLTPTLVDALLERLRAVGPEAMAPEAVKALESHCLLLKGEALYALGQAEEGRRIFNILRAAHPDSGPAVLSYLIEARGYAAENSLVTAQQGLIQLADAFPESEYAPVALWEAALNAEQRGTDGTWREAIALLERLVTTYPTHRLVFHARLKQGDLSRKLNDFGSALLLYERILALFPNHPERWRAELSRADCQLARGSQYPAAIAEAAEAYERILERTDAPVDARAEAGAKWVAALRLQGGAERARNAAWMVVSRFQEQTALRQALGAQGRYWLSRTVFVLVDLLEADGRRDEARRLCTQIIAEGLPGADLARSRLES